MTRLGLARIQPPFGGYLGTRPRPSQIRTGAKAIQWPAGKISVEGWPNGYGGEVETPPALGPGTEQGSGKSD